MTKQAILEHVSFGRLEAESGLDVVEEELEEIRLVQDIVDLVHRRLGSEPSAG